GVYQGLLARSADAGAGPARRRRSANRDQAAGRAKHRRRRRQLRRGVSQLWGGRFSTSLDESALRYTTSLPVDRRLFEWDVLGSIAHARMLGRIGVLAPTDVAALVDGLAGLLREPPSLNGQYEDIHSLVEAELGKRIGEPAG